MSVQATFTSPPISFQKRIQHSKAENNAELLPHFPPTWNGQNSGHRIDSLVSFSSPKSNRQMLRDISFYEPSSSRDHWGSSCPLPHLLCSSDSSHITSLASLEPPIASGVRELPAGIKISNQKKPPRQKTQSPRKWEQYKSVMQEIYMKEGNLLPDLKRIMRDSHGFDASDKQYKTQLKEWGWVKYLPRDRASFMQRKAKYRQDTEKKQTVFLWGGKSWTKSRVDKSAKLDQSQQIHENPATPEDISYHTPFPEPELEQQGTDNLPDNDLGCLADQEEAPTSSATISSPHYSENEVQNPLNQAIELKSQDDDKSCDAYMKALNISLSLDPLNVEETTSIAYEAASLVARKGDVQRAKQILQAVTDKLVVSFGAKHRVVVEHVSKTTELYVQWNDHEAAVELMSNLTNGFSTSTLNPGISPKPSLNYPPDEPATCPHLHPNNLIVTESSQLMVELHRILSSSPDSPLAATGKKALDLIHRMETSPSDYLPDIPKAYSLLIAFYSNRASPNDAQAAANAAQAALHDAKTSILTLLPLTHARTASFFRSSLPIAQKLLSISSDDSARDLLDRLEARFSAVLGNEHPETISLLISIGKMYQNAKQWDRAAPWFRHAYSACILKFGHGATITRRLEEALQTRRYACELDPELRGASC